MIDDELLQELLAKASGLYNNGDYSGAIAAWKEALHVDPSSQKAREGIQMATLLLADWDPRATSMEGPEPAVPADGARSRPERLTPAQRSARLGEGVTRVRALLRERKYSEAIEGARGLVPIDPDSDEVQRLIDEAQQAFESAPFIEEHLALARELAAQERFEEAEAECRKVFVLDPANPDALALTSDVRARGEVPAVPADAAGVTMRMDVADLIAAQAATADPHGPTGKAAPAAQAGDGPQDASGAPDMPDAQADAGSPTGSEPEDWLEPQIGVGSHTESGAQAGSGSETGSESQADAFNEADAAAGLAESLPDDLMDLDLDPPGPQAIKEQAGTFAEEFPIDLDAKPPVPADPEAAAGGMPEIDELDLELTPGAPAQALPAEPEDEAIVDAETVVPPTVRLVPRTGEPAESVEAFLEKTEDVESIPLAQSTSAPAAPAAPVAAPARAAAPVGWEEELESLNLKTGEHDIVGRSAARNATPAAPAGDEMDLSSLLGDDMVDLPGATMPAGDPPSASPSAPRPAAPSPSPLDELAGGLDDDLAAIESEPKADEPASDAPVPMPAPEPAEERAPRSVAAAPARPRPRLAVPPMMFAVLGVVILAGAAAVWWLVYQPKNAAAQVGAPPAGDPPADAASTEPGGGPIPTPIGSTSRQSAEAAPEGSAAAAAGAVPAPADDTRDARPAGGAPAGAGAAAPGTAAPEPHSERPSPEELRRRAERHLSEGRRYMAAEKWQEARSELAAALALDPVNFECKEMLDQAQAKVDEEMKVMRDLDEARRAFVDKDYQGSLWKLYRLPRDRRLGDIDLYIRNAWFNWAVVGLKGGDATDARQKLTEVLTADPDDEEAQKLMDVAERYASRSKDRVFYSFVDTLRFRAFDQP